MYVRTGYDSSSINKYNYGMVNTITRNVHQLIITKNHIFGLKSSLIFLRVAITLIGSLSFVNCCTVSALQLREN